MLLRAVANLLESFADTALAIAIIVSAGAYVIAAVLLALVIQTTVSHALLLLSAIIVGGSVLALGKVSDIVAERMRRRIHQRRPRPGSCSACGYDLQGLPSAATCPECGSEASSSD